MSKHKEQNGKTGASFSRNPIHCITGWMLRTKAPKSSCSHCYACEGYFHLDRVKAALDRNLWEWNTMTHADWVAMMVKRIGNEPYFRWFSRGDLQSLEMLQCIAMVATLTPGTKHWLPTKEIGMLAQYHKKVGYYPGNLCVRISAYGIDKPVPPSLMKRLGVGSHNVSNNRSDCTADQRGGACHPCRRCWDSSVPTTTFKLK